MYTTLPPGRSYDQQLLVGLMRAGGRVVGRVGPVASGTPLHLMLRSR